MSVAADADGRDDGDAKPDADELIDDFLGDDLDDLADAARIDHDLGAAVALGADAGELAGRG